MSRVRTNGRKPAPLDPKAEQIAHARAQIGSLLNEGNATQAADAYQRMLEEFGHDTNAPLTLHREAQYQIANTLYQREDRVAAADAFERLLASYPADPERGIIRVLIARTRAWDQEDFTSAIAMLESLKDDTLDDETRSLVESELDQFRQHASNAQPPTPQEPES
jgi:outer membrane protein assembly factor BamD (BamD/ComL family)